MGHRTPLSGDLHADVTAARETLGRPDDLVVRRLRLPYGIPGTVLYLKHLVDQDAIGHFLIRPLLNPDGGEPPATVAQLPGWLEERVLVAASVRRLRSVEEVTEALLEGQAAVLVSGAREALGVEAADWAVRAPEEPRTEVVIRGPREGFTEHLPDNVAMIRRRLHDPRLRLRQLSIGRLTRTRVAVLYVEGVAAHDLVDRVFSRLQRIRTDAVLESGYIEQFIEDRPLALFPQVMHTERPDRVVASLLEGRVAILVDGTAFALVLPCTAGMFLQSPEDYYERPVLTVLARLVRLAAVTTSALLPAVYVAFTSYHPEMLPTELALNVLSAQLRLPFSPAIEAFLLEIFLEMLLEGSVRLPSAVGPTVSIVGALIIGEMAVRAGIAGPIMVIVIAITALASYAVPGYVLAFSVKVARIALLVLAGFFGLIGLMVGVNVLFVHMASLESFGVPYLSPLTPLNVRDMKDFVARAALWRMRQRPDELEPAQRRRQPRRASYLQHDPGGEGP